MIREQLNLLIAFTEIRNPQEFKFAPSLLSLTSPLSASKRKVNKKELFFLN